MRNFAKSDEKRSGSTGEPPTAAERHQGSGPYPPSPIDGDWTLHRDAGEAAANEQERLRAIAERAYLRAERREFEPGQELDDWLAAEAEEDATVEPR